MRLVGYLYEDYGNARSLEHKVGVSNNPVTPWSRVLPRKLTGTQIVKKFPAFYETGRFITAFRSAHHLSLS
jgi:hypothetical protein